MDALTISSGFTIHLTVPQVQRGHSCHELPVPFHTGWKSWVQSDSSPGVVLSRLTGHLQEEACSSTAVRGRPGLPWVLLPHGSTLGTTQCVEWVQTHILSRASWLPVAHSILTVTFPWESHINTIRSCQGVFHDSNLDQNFKDFGQGG